MRNLVLAVLLAVGCIHPALGDERNTFFGKDVGSWIEVLRDKASPARERWRAIWALGYFGPEAREAVPLLIDAGRLSTTDKDLAIETLGRIGPGAEAAVPILIERFIQGGCVHRTGMGTFFYNASAENALVRIGTPAVPALLVVMNGPDEDMQVCAAEALGKIGPAARSSVPRLIQAMEQPNPGRNAEIMREHAIRALGRIGPDAKAAVPTLNRWLGQNAVENDREIVIALDKIGAPPSEKLLDLFLREGDYERAVELACLGPRAKGIAPGLRMALADKRPQVRLGAAVALTSIDPPAPEAIPLLVEALDNPEYEEVGIGASVLPLARLGPAAKVATPKLLELARKKNLDRDLLRTLVKTDVLRALVTIAPDDPECVPVLIEALKNEDEDVVFNASTSLAILGVRARSAIPSLVEIIRNRIGKRDNIGLVPDQNLRTSAIRSLGRIDPDSPLVVPVLLEVLKEWPDRSKKPFNDEAEKTIAIESVKAALKVLGIIGPRAKAAVPSLMGLLATREDDQDYGIIEEALWTLGRIGPDAKAAIPVLREKAKEKKWNSISEKIVLSRLAPESIVELEKLLEKPLMGGQTSWLASQELRSRAKVLGAMGRSSVETDWAIRKYLEQMDSMFHDLDDPRGDGPSEYLESWLEELGRYGVAARLAIPLLNDYRQQRDPWVRMWATEALQQITPTPPPKSPKSD